ncbi:MAG: 2-C-methyl-D-erythritol 2,4-cyclodiphosphate synthase [Clostridium sp.]|jgi:2-C-methyl-D-erythritol 2,4-cyclodiphosphate synthase|nr:2-C-methyl-D-erythritol 2,4-cyclodiphosphate synthase [Clostridium sp.]
MRVGIGYDVHRLVEGRKLIIGGVEIPYEKGLLGHSDADVLTHTIMDALLGAAGLGDLGTHFPDTAEEFKDSNSLDLLKQVKNMLKERSYKILNIDAVIIAQEPKMNPHLPLMKEILAKVLEISIEDINLKATTEEGLGFTGTKEGMASQAVVLIDKRF